MLIENINGYFIFYFEKLISEKIDIVFTHSYTSPLLPQC